LAKLQLQETYDDGRGPVRQSHIDHPSDDCGDLSANGLEIPLVLCFFRLPGLLAFIVHPGTGTGGAIHRLQTNRTGCGTSERMSGSNEYPEFGLHVRVAAR